MLTKLFKDNTESKNPATRRAAVDKLAENDPSDQKKLMRLASGDIDDSVRIAAIQKVTDPFCLTALLGDEPAVEYSTEFRIRAPSEEVIKVVRARLEHMLTEPGQLDATDTARLAATGSREACVLIACHASDESNRNAVLIMLDQQEQLARVVVESRYHSTRAAAAEKLSDNDIMTALASTMKERDKVVARSLQQRVEETRAEIKRTADHQLEIGQLIEAMQQLSESVWSPQYVARFDAVEERWHKLEPAPSPEQHRQYQEHQAKALVLVEESKNRQLAKDFCAEALRTTTALRQQLKTSTLAELAENVKSMRQESVNAQASWRVSFDAASPDRTTVIAYESNRDALQSELNNCDKLIELELPQLELEKIEFNQAQSCLQSISQLLGDIDAVPPSASTFILETAQIGKKLRSRVKQLGNEHDAKIKSIQKQLNVLSATISDGKWSPANSLYKRIEKKIITLQGQAEAKSLTDRLARHRAKLDELADWQNFAAKPKLEALCEQMEQWAGIEQNVVEVDDETTNDAEPPAAKSSTDTDVSVDAVLSEHPQSELFATPLTAQPDPKDKSKFREWINERAANIKALQSQWKELGPSPVANELWERFKTASDLAYRPVGEYRQTQQVEREKRSANKLAICQDLDAFLADIDWETADWKQVEKTLRKAKLGWRDNRITDRKPDKELEQRFSELVSCFNEKLDVQYDQNAQAKEQLIEKVKKLSESDINQHVINQTRRLQNSWKQTGIMRRKQDQELWEQFNGYCRTIYKQHRSSEKAKFESEISHVREAKEIIRSIRELVKNNDVDEKKFNTLQERFNALAEFPEKDKKFLLRDFKKVSDQYSKAKDKNVAQSIKAEWAELLRKSEICIRYEELVLNRQEVDNKILEDLEHEWSTTTVHLPKTWERKISARKKSALVHLDKKTEYEYDDAERQRRLLCIKLEILKGKDSPAEDKDLRMNYQLEHLQKGIGNAATNDKESEINALVLQWHCMPPGIPSNRERLYSRFSALVE